MELRNTPQKGYMIGSGETFVLQQFPMTNHITFIGNVLCRNWSIHQNLTHDVFRMKFENNGQKPIAFNHDRETWCLILRVKIDFHVVPTFFQVESQCHHVYVIIHGNANVTFTNPKIVPPPKSWTENLINKNSADHGFTKFQQ